MACWESDHFKLVLLDGSWFNYLPCDDGRCFWIGYQDVDKNALQFVRDTHLALWQLTASDGQGIKFQPDTQARITARDTKGNHVTYEYNAAGCLERVHYADGQVEEYEYDSRHLMTSISAGSRANEKRHSVLKTDYEEMGRVARLTLADGSIYKIDYFATVKDRVARVRVTDPKGRVSDLAVNDDGYTVRTTPIRFPALAGTSAQEN
jgi:YD repeat-containing protein